MMWTFDIKKTQHRLELLNQYYTEQGLNACNFTCSKYEDCIKSQKQNTVKQFSGGTAGLMPFYDISYDNKPIRILIIGKETGYMKNSEYGTSIDFIENNSNVLNCINWVKKNNHIKGVLYILQYIFNTKTEYIYSSYTLTNLLRCSFQTEDKIDNVSDTKDTLEMRQNCVNYLINEIKILEPTLIIAQGEWAIKQGFLLDNLTRNFGKNKCLKMNNSNKYGLYEFNEFYYMSTHHPAILGNWIKNLAPDSVWPMIDCLHEIGVLPVIPDIEGDKYEKIVKPEVDKIIATLPINDGLRNGKTSLQLSLF